MIMKRRGERGHPCLNPLLLWKKEVGQPLTREAIRGDSMQEAIHRMKKEVKPNFLMILNRKECLELIKRIFKI